MADANTPLRLVLMKTAISLTLIATIAQAQQDATTYANSTIADKDGTVYMTRVVPIPNDLSPEAQARMRHASNGKGGGGGTLEQQRHGVAAWHTGAGKKSLAMFPVQLNEATIAGVPVRDVRPLPEMDDRKDCVLMDLHGGAFVFDSGSLTETIPIANMTHTRVVSVLYRLAPENPYPAQLNDAVMVYRELLKTYPPENIVIFGTSAGAILTGEVAVRLKQLGVPEPAALGIFSGSGDLSMSGDSQAFFTLQGLEGSPDIPDGKPFMARYLAGHDAKDPVVSPIYADLHGLPPTLFISSERDALLSGTINLHRAFLRAGVDARLIVFDGLAHTFWNEAELPESREAYGYIARFLVSHLGSSQLSAQTTP